MKLDVEPFNRYAYHDPRAIVAALLQGAIQKTIEADDPLYARLPPPVRYRATGAIDAWKRVMQEGHKTGDADFWDGMRRFPLAVLYKEFPRFLKGWAHSLPSGLSQESAQLAHRSLVWQIYFASEGAMYEPTAALHRLLDSAYIADDVPIGMIELPAAATCIIPNPEWQGYKQGIRAIALFHRHGRDTAVPDERLSLVSWQEFGKDHIRIKFVDYPLADRNKTIQQILEQDVSVSEQNAELEADREHWRLVSDYAIKMLLYLKIPDAQVVADRAYSNAPRDFKGLGQRKRKERLAQIEHLYDRHIVGPAVLDWEHGAHSEADSGAPHHEKRGHWRRPHFKMQPHGPNSSLRKVIFVGPVIVRPDRLGL